MDANTEIRVLQPFSTYPAAIWEAVDVDGSALSTIDKVLFVALWSHANNKTGTAFPSVETLAAECSCKRRAVQYALAKLEAVALLERRPRMAAGGRQTSNVYILNTPADALRVRGAPGARGGCTTCAPEGASGARDLTDPQELDPANISKAGSASGVSPDLSRDTVAVVSQYRGITGTDDVNLSQASKWLQRYGLAKIEEKLGMLRREVIAGRHIPRPRGWVAKALAEDWPPVEDRDVAAVEASRRHNAEVLAEAARAEAEKVARQKDPAGQEKYMTALRQAKQALQ